MLGTIVVSSDNKRAEYSIHEIEMFALYGYINENFWEEVTSFGEIKAKVDFSTLLDYVEL